MQVKPPPKIFIGIFTYNEEKHIAEALDSLLAQTYQDFRLIVLDDQSTDNTEQIILERAARDDRIIYSVNKKREGYISNYFKTFAQADEDTDYFAWAAGHDVHHPRWLETMLRTLEESPDTVMAYCLTRRIGDRGENLNVPSPVLDTSAMNVKERMKLLSITGEGFGNMIYGLFRADILRKTGVFRRHVTPDTVLLWELALHGYFSQVNEELWFRRYYGTSSVKRQKKNAFGSSPPWYIYFPYSLVNVSVLTWNMALKPGLGDLGQRFLGLWSAWIYFVRYLRFTRLGLGYQGVIQRFFNR